VPPLPDPSKSTRERYAIHATDPECSQCHDAIDAFGFSFEGFDAMGGYRTMDNTPVDTNVTVALGTDFDGTYASSNELAAAMSQAPSVQACFARNLFRSATGRSAGEDALATEQQFLDFVKTIDGADKGNIVETLVAYVQSTLFAQRRNP
jgi:hypothetical protein